MKEDDADRPVKQGCLQSEELASLVSGDNSDPESKRKLQHLKECPVCFENYSKLMLLLHRTEVRGDNTAVVKVFSHPINLKAILVALVLFAILCFAPLLFL